MNYGKVPQRSAVRPPVTEDDPRFYNTRMPSSSRRYQAGDVQTVRRGNQQLEVHYGPPPRHRLFHRIHPLVYIIGTILMIVLFVQIWGWWQGVQLDQKYGMPRTSQLDAVVGHNDSEANPTHFIFLNLHGHVEIIEIPGGDASKARIFTGPTLIGAGQDLTPVTGEVVSENGRLDLIIHIQSQQVVYINDGSTFHQQ